MSPIAAVAAALALAAPLAACTASRAPALPEPQVGQAGKDVAWIPTPEGMVEKMLDVAQVAPGERLVDLGSGDGRIAIAAARRGAIAKGIEYNAELVEHSRARAREAGVNVELVHGDIFLADFRDADVVTMYLLDHLNQKLRPRLLAMKPGTRIVSYHFHMGPWPPDETVGFEGREAYLWHVPARVEGEWDVRIGHMPGPRLRLVQRYQHLEGEARWGATASALTQASIRGAAVSFVATDAANTAQRFEGVAGHGGPITGVVGPVAGGPERPFIATRR